MSIEKRFGQGQELLEDTLNKASGVLSKLKSPGTSIGIGGPITFPADLEDGQEAIRFEFFRQYQFDRKENKKEEGASLVIYLPIPQNIQAAYSVQYEQAELGALGREGARVAAGKGIDTSAENVAGGALNLLAQAVDSGAAGAAITGGAAKAGSSIKGKVLSKIGGGIGAIAGGITAGGLKGVQFGLGTARNPHMAQVFKNVQFRSHQLAFKLAPKSIEEQNRLRDIIKAFKIAMHPNYRLAGHFFDYPGQFDIDLVTGKSDQYFFNMGPSVLTSMSVDYLPNGPQVHSIDGTKAPIAVSLSLTFTELQIVTQREIKEFNY